MPIGKMTFIPVYELRQEQNCQRSGNITGEQPLTAYPFPCNLLKFGRGYEIEIYHRVDYLEQVIAKQKIPGKKLPFHYPQEQVKAQHAVGKYEQSGGRAGVNMSQEREWIAVSGSGNQKEEEIQSGQKVQTEWAVYVVIFGFRHITLWSRPRQAGQSGRKYPTMSFHQ